MPSRIATALMVMVFIFPAFAHALVCGKDLDGDGMVTGQGETAQCVGDGGTLCPIGAVQCTADRSEPTCPDGGVFVPGRDRCEASSPRFTCSLDGRSYDSSSACGSACVQIAACTSVLLPPLHIRLYICPLNSQVTCDEAHNCSVAGTCSGDSCSTGYTWDGSFCAAPAQCSRGVYVSEEKKCVDQGAYACPLGGAFPCVDNNGTAQCSANACFDPSAPGNEVTEESDSSMLQDDGERDSEGNCLGAIYIFSGRSMECRTSGHSTGWKNCCLSGESPLADDVGSVASLSTAASTISNVYHMGQIAYHGNMIASGVAVDVAGFTPAVQTGLTAVAQSGSVMEGLMTYAQATFLNPTTLAIAAAMYLIQEAFFAGSCNQEDVETAMLENSGMCHYLTTYCKKRWPLVGCVQEAKVFCCFNSKLARVVHEQGRPQLSAFSPAWFYGHSSGNCRGFTASEFQMLDFSKMDLSEYLGDMKIKAESAIRDTVTDKVQQYYQGTRP
ncbi:MAG: conjugal transfer mating pair stabilization protein TraN [Syntrophorhabdaceae bacterium PtaU1.Bin034]|nr:MAG: conjugal transfer mating pair stabilization protein TraN [Syntrophorhabdaceae bacterium PtaU1.Bin034]